MKCAILSCAKLKHSLLVVSSSSGGDPVWWTFQMTPSICCSSGSAWGDPRYPVHSA